MKGYKEADCWKENPDKAPAWYKTKTEDYTAQGAVDVKAMLCNLEVDQDAMCDIQDSKLGLGKELLQPSSWRSSRILRNLVCRYAVASKIRKDAR